MKKCNVFYRRGKDSNGPIGVGGGVGRENRRGREKE